MISLFVTDFDMLAKPTEKYRNTIYHDSPQNLEFIFFSEDFPGQCGTGNFHASVVC
jgi:hypothetical protein